MESLGIIKHLSDKMFHPAPLADLRRLAKQGKIRPVPGNKNAFEEIEAGDPEPQVYATRDLVAEPGTRRSRAQYRSRRSPAE